MNWKWWAKAYYVLLFSRDLWLCPLFVLIEIAMVLGCFDSKSPFRDNPLIHVLLCFTALFVFAFVITSIAVIHANIIYKAREKIRLEQKRIDTILDAFQEQIKHEIQKPSPWFLGDWTNYLNESE